MRSFVAAFVIVTVASLAAACIAQERAEPAQPPPPPSAGQPARPEPPPPRPDPDEEHAPGFPGPGIDEPPPGRPPGPGGHEPRPPRPPGSPFDPLLRLIGEQHPDLAERLERLRRESPDVFRDVLREALSARLEDALGQLGPLERGPSPDSQRGRPPRERPGEDFGRFGGPPPGGGPGPEGIPAETLARLHELEEQHRQLEDRSREVAARLVEARKQGAAEDAQRALREELRQVVRTQFDVRSELRQMDLLRMQNELQRLQAALQRLQHELERRDREREAIIERRVEQLAGADSGAW